jgi:hypothetical protein
MKPVRTLTPEWEISDWPVKLTGKDENPAVDFLHRKGAPSLGK